MFFDFLDSPVITLGIPLVVLVVRHSACGGAGTGWSSGIHLAALIALAAVGWAFGYLYLWALKWVLATLVTGQDVFSSAFGQAAIYSGGSAESKGSVLDAVDLNIQALGFVRYALLATAASAFLCALVSGGRALMARSRGEGSAR